MVMKKANVSELKAKLSAYLAEVRGGTTVVVYDRATPIAKLEPLTSQDDLEIIDATSPPTDLKQIKGVRPRKAVNVDRLLADLRKDR
jgi:prevent-host-death family protein